MAWISLNSDGSRNKRLIHINCVCVCMLCVRACIFACLCKIIWRNTLVTSEDIYIITHIAKWSRWNNGSQWKPGDYRDSWLLSRILYQICWNKISASHLFISRSRTSYGMFIAIIWTNIGLVITAPHNNEIYITLSVCLLGDDPVSPPL